MTNRRAKASTAVPLNVRTCAGRVEIVSRCDPDSSAFRIAALLIESSAGIPDAHDLIPTQIVALSLNIDRRLAEFLKDLSYF
jgi:hypothetical protein